MRHPDAKSGVSAPHPSNGAIPIYGTLQSTWSAAGGVPVEKGMAYVAAGLANYDGTHVYALDCCR